MAATSLTPLTTAAQDALAPGSVATNAAGEPILVRQSPGYDAAGNGEVAAGGQVTVADYAVTAADGSLWYPVAGGYVPASALASGAAPVAETAAAPVAEAAAAPISGYYDANGVWVEEVAATDPAAAPVSGYYDANGVWIEDGTAGAPVAETATGSGYYDQNGVWVDTSGATTTEATAPAESTTGYYDQNGVWVDTSGAATTEAAAPVTTDASQPAAEPGTGYYDQNGVWVDTSGAATDLAAAPAPAGTGYYDQNGVWVDTTAAADSAVQYNDASGVSNTTATSVPVGTAYITGTNGDGAICRSGADWAAGEIATVGEGSAIDVTGGAVGEWVPVNCNGVGGYVNSSFISWDQPVATTAQESDTRQRRRNRDQGGNNAGGGATGVSGQPLVDFAMSYLGSPYVYAGAGPSGFDCSGFTMFVVQNTLGMNIGHGVPGQYGAGTPVSQGQLAPGDLVFFQNTAGPGLSHVGIYIGNGQFIHAENESTGVVISDLNSGYYSSHYYGAVRLG